MLYDLFELFEISFGEQDICIGSQIWRDYMVKFREILKDFFISNLEIWLFLGRWVANK